MEEYQVVIVGGSYAGLSCALSLGRSLRSVLVIDSGTPCNRQTPHSHNFITQDGEKPEVIADKALKQIQQYKTVHFINDWVTDAQKIEKGFLLRTKSGRNLIAQKLVWATGLKDVMPNIPGFAECWGISVIHCPYCHGYEVRNQPTGILADGDHAYHYASLIRNWSKELVVLTNGKTSLSAEQIQAIKKSGIGIVEKKIVEIVHDNGHVQEVVFDDRSTIALRVIYSRPAFEQQSNIPERLGCKTNEQGLLQVDPYQKTSEPNIYACGDNSNVLRSVALAVSSGSITGAMVNHALAEEEFNLITKS